MILFNILSNPILFIGFVAGILIAITVHECAHAYIAYKLGDATAKLEGRVSLNPIVHLDFFGTLMLLLAGFGWGKPVPVNAAMFRSKWDEVWVALAGAGANAITALVLAVIARFLPIESLIYAILLIIIQINLMLMIFNLIPIPPLDGSALLKVILPRQAYLTLLSMSNLLFIAFIIFLYSTPIFSKTISLLIGSIMQMLLGK